MEGRTRVRKVIQVPSVIESIDDIPAEVYKALSKYFSQFCNHEPIISVDHLVNEKDEKTAGRWNGCVWLNDEELKEYYKYEKLIDEGKL